MVRFSCGSDISAELCLFNSSCALDPYDNEYCKCDLALGFVHDHTILHIPNCSMPNWFLLANFIVSTVGTFVSLALMIYTYRLIKTEVRELISIFVCGMLLFWFVNVSLYVQGEIREAGLLFLAFGAVILPYLGIRLGLFVLKPIYAMTKHDITSTKRTLYAVCMVFSLATVIPELCGVVLVSGENVNTYNTVMAIHLIPSGLLFMCITSIGLISTRRLQRAVYQLLSNRMSMALNTKTDDELNNVFYRLHGFQICLAALFVIGFVIEICGWIIFALGSLPFMYIIAALTYNSFWPLAAAFVRFLGPKHKTRFGFNTSPRRSKSKESITPQQT